MLRLTLPWMLLHNHQPYCKMVDLDWKACGVPGVFLPYDPRRSISCTLLCITQHYKTKNPGTTQFIDGFIGTQQMGILVSGICFIGYKSEVRINLPAYLLHVCPKAGYQTVGIKLSPFLPKTHPTLYLVQLYPFPHLSPK